MYISCTCIHMYSKTYCINDPALGSIQFIFLQTHCNMQELQQTNSLICTTTYTELLYSAYEHELQHKLVVT